MTLAEFTRNTNNRSVDEIISQNTVVVEVEWKSNLSLVVDNFRCLHGRASGANTSPSRRLRRWLLKEF